MKKLKLILPTIILFCSHATGQNNTVTGLSNEPGNNLSHSGPNIIPPSPEAFNFTRYGNLPVGLFTGSAQFSIPVYTVSSGLLSHSISLDYSTNGIKVDEIASRVGLGWTLKVGGTITRTVQGLPDEFSSRTFYHRDPYDTTTIWDFWEYVRQANYATPPDFQPDEYSFNVDGLSGKFIKREDGSFRILSASGTKIEQDNYSLNFTLTSTTGTKYYFNLQEKTKTLSNVEPTTPLNEPGYTTTAWYLTKILSPTKDSILFNYTAFADTVKYHNGVSQEFSTYIPTDFSYRSFRLNEVSTYELTEGGTYGLPACLDLECLYLSTNEQISGSLGFYLSSISFKEGSVAFITSDREDVAGEKKIDTIKVLRSGDFSLIKCFKLQHTYSNNTASTFSHAWTTSYLQKRLFLTSFSEVSKDLSSHHEYKFDYDSINALPPRLCYAQDQFGFFNGKLNTYFFPNNTWLDYWLGGAGFGGNRNYDYNYAKRGVLNKIIYPTGGFSKIEYEPNRTKNLIVYQNLIDSVTVAIDTSTSLNQNTDFYSDTFHLAIGRSLTFSLKCDWATNPAPYFPEAYYAVGSIIDVSNNTCVPGLCNFSVFPGSDYFDYQLQQKLAIYNSTGGIYKIKISATQAGLRIKSRVDRIKATIDTSKNVGIAGIRVKAVSDFSKEYEETNRREFLYGEWTDILQQHTSGQGIILDPNNLHFVTAVRKLANTIRSISTTDKRIYAGNNILHSNSVRSIYRNENGTVVYSKVIELNHSKNNTNIGGTEYEFIAEEKTSALPLSNSLGAYVWSFSPYQADGFPLNNNDFKNGLTKSVKTFTYQNKFSSRTILSESNNYYSLDSNLLVTDTFFLVRQIIKRPHDYGNTWRWFYDFDLNRYYRYFGWVKLDSTIQKSHSGSQTFSNKTSYSYTTANYKVALENHYLSDGSTRYVNYRYPPNIGYSETDYPDYLQMSLQNIIDPPIYQATNKNSTTKAQQTYYNLFTVGGNSFYLPSTTNSKFNSNTEVTELTIDQYDANGKILQFTPRNGVATSIIWGYNNTYPVAKVQGATYANCIAVLNTSILDNPASDYALRTELNKLRNQLTGNEFVTTITYSPLIGATSETDVNNRTVYYEYDNFNRLKLVRDQNSNIVKKLCYNYKGEETECNENPTYPEEPCSNITNCVGENKMCLSGTCVTSTDKELVSSTYQGNGIWECIYVYNFVNGLTTIQGPEIVEYSGLGGCLEFD